MKLTNLLFLKRDDEILLAMKKRGFGVGKLNGVGGKVGPNETIEAGVIRETKEEIGVEVDEKDLKKVAELTFIFKEKEGWDIICHVFFVEKWAGEPLETEEMAPRWTKISELPFDKMWIDDRFWLPHVLAGKNVTAEFRFLGDGGILDSYTINGK